MTAGEWVDSLNDIVKKYRAGAIGTETAKSALADALVETRKLGLSDGDAIRYLVPRSKKGLT